MSVDSTTTVVDPASHSHASDTPKPTVWVKNCCQVPREQPCEHDLPAAAFEPGCGKPIMCRPVREWNA